MKTLYFDCTSGISGDMIVGALLDLGADEQVMRKALAGLAGEGVKIVTERVMKNALDCCNFDVVLDEEHENHDHDMEYLFGHEEHHHDHHDDPQPPSPGDHAHRNLADVLRIIDSLEMTPSARKLAGRVFEILAEAEGKAHGKDMHEVHFHEVGALDSIADIVAAAVCFDNLGIDRVVIPKLCEGTGTIRCAHGILPIPVPAVMNVASAYGLPIAVTDRRGELITPTGAAFAAAVMTDRKLPETFVPQKVGLGAGKRAYEIPSILRAVVFESGNDEKNCHHDSSDNKVSDEESRIGSSFEGSSRIGKSDTQDTKDTVWKLETNIDDCTGEELGFALELLFNGGARDAFYTPVYMKKNRPAWLLTVICDEDKISAMEDIIFRNTSTIGIRRQRMKRTCLPRRKEVVSTEYGDVEVKICTYKETEMIYPEYESAATVARDKGISLGDAFKKAVDAYKAKRDVN